MKLKKRITIVKGNDKDFTVRVKKDGNPVDLTDVSIFCEVKDKPNGNLLFNAIITITDAVNGIFKVRFPKEETQNLALQRVYFDFRFVFIDGTEKNFPTPPLEAVVVERVTD